MQSTKNKSQKKQVTEDTSDTPAASQLDKSSNAAGAAKKKPTATASQSRNETTVHVNAVEPKSGKEAELEITTPVSDFLEAMRNLDLSDAAVKRMIDKLDISADAKSLLYTLSKTTIHVGEHVIKAGRKILDYACQLLKEFPNTAFGLVLGGIAGALFSAIPGLGQLLGPFISSILMLIGFLGGAFLDFQDKLLTRKIAASVAEQNQRLAEQIDLKVAEIYSPSHV